MPSANDRLMEQIFQLKFTTKQLARSAKKAEKDEKAEKNKVKKAIEKGNVDGARIHAQNAIRKKSEQLNYLRLSSRLDAVASRLDTQAKMNAVGKNMASIVKTLDRALKAQNLEQISTTMDTFERQFEDLDVRTDFMETAMNNTTAGATPEDQVNLLMQEVAEEHQLDLSAQLAQEGAVPGAPVAAPAQPAQVEAADDLSGRLAALRGGS